MVKNRICHQKAEIIHFHKTQAIKTHLLGELIPMNILRKLSLVTMGIGTFMISTLSLLSPAQSAPRGFHVCNETGENIEVAIAYYESDYGNDIWTTEGWYNLSRTECKTIHSSLENSRWISFR
ncbi:DUF1036 domain-containing protein [Limnofasciculus baicalensis]|uniref:DUF1036 domain-containing protein n=1 Tax=Limnofasciculus baicalensis BBK-W-15 TaxID=2699891 RepID=A0AAE3H0S7_9CYAN|nr:DUF1036 domain-containing protein [Limnofasciculus baicalensis]MCP2732172.1 DUF1036 domain-containing protein [Limnofasciculus baicalensis BBK-W-15]